MNARKRQRRARVMKLAEKYRRNFYADDEKFSAMEHLDFELSKRDDILICHDLFKGSKSDEFQRIYSD